MKKIIFLFLIVHCTLVIDNCFSQWQSDVRLTNNTASSQTSFNNAWCIAASGSVVHVVWFDARDLNSEIYYKRSTDAGVSWGTDTRLTNNSATSEYPSVTVSGSAVHVVWEDVRDGNKEIYYKRSIDGGVSWGADTRLTNNTANSWYPSVTVSGSVVHVVWQDFRDGTYEIYYKRSTDGGVSWGTDTRLTNNPFTSWNTSVTVSGSVVHVVWEDTRDYSDIYYKRSTDGGVSWETDTRLTASDFALSEYPSVTVSGLIVHVVWEDNRDGNKEIYYKRSTGPGDGWEADLRLTNNTASSDYPSVTISGLVVHVVWIDERDGNEEIYYKRSTDGGTNWGADTRLTINTASSYLPSVAVSGQVVHVVWRDNRDGNQEIYYKRDPTGNPFGIININSEVPNQFSLSQNYPNPFNPKTIINFKLRITNYVNLKVYDLLGNEVSVLVNEQLQPGTYEVDWDGSGFASGVYYYTLEADPETIPYQSTAQGSGFRETKKMVLMK